MKYFKAVIEETRRKTVFIQVPDDADHVIAENQYYAALYGDLPMKECDKITFNDDDRDVDTENRLVSVEEADMEKEEEYAERYYEFPECIIWDDEMNCQTSGWNN